MPTVRQVEKNFYSVPHPLVGSTVKFARPSDSSKCSSTTGLRRDARSPFGTGKMSTVEAHTQTETRHKRFRSAGGSAAATAVGPHTSELVETLVAGDYPLKHLRRIQGILRLQSSRHVSPAALEYACEMALRFQKPRLQYIKSCAEHFNAQGTKLRLVKPERAVDALYLHEKASSEVTP
jgi:hypothetical protein